MALSEQEELELLLLERERRNRQSTPAQAENVQPEPDLGVLGSIVQQQRTVDPIGTTLGQVALKGQELFDKGGEKLAETLAGPGLTQKPFAGIPGAPLAPTPAVPGEEAIKTSPEVAAGIGTGVSMIPDVATSALPIGAAPKVAKAAKPFVSAFKPGGVKALGAAIGEAEAKAGIRETIPNVKSLAQDLQMPKGSNFTDIVNTVKAKLDAGVEIPIQTLAEFDDLVNTMFSTGKIIGKTRAGALVSKAAQAARKKLNQLIPSRGEATSEFRTAKKFQDVLKVGGGLGAVGAIGEAARRSIIKALK